MSEVKRYVALKRDMIETPPALVDSGREVVVLASDYDAIAATVSEQAALIESLQNRWASRPLSVEDTAALEKDAVRLDFIIKQQAFFSYGTGDAGNRICQLLCQDVDENYIELSSWHQSERSAIDAAMESPLADRPD